MVTPKKNPTNADLMREIQGVKAVQTEQGKHIETLMEWKIATQAVDSYIAKQQQAAETKTIDWQKILLAALGLVATALTIVAAVVAANQK